MGTKQNSFAGLEISGICPAGLGMKKPFISLEGVHFFYQNIFYQNITQYFNPVFAPLCSWYDKNGYSNFKISTEPSRDRVPWRDSWPQGENESSNTSVWSNEGGDCCKGNTGIIKT